MAKAREKLGSVSPQALYQRGVLFKQRTTVLQDKRGTGSTLYTVGAGVFVLLRATLAEEQRRLLLQTVHVFAEGGKRAALEIIFGGEAEQKVGQSLIETVQTYLESLAARDEARREQQKQEAEHGEQGNNVVAGDFGKGVRTSDAAADGGGGEAPDAAN